MTPFANYCISSLTMCCMHNLITLFNVCKQYRYTAACSKLLVQYKVRSVARSLRKFFPTDQSMSTRQIWSPFVGICWCSYAASFTAKISSLKLSWNEKPFWMSSQNSEYPRIIRVKGTNQNVCKSLCTDLVNTNGG